ncbi:hypothetical protein NDU88_000037 [Pleurodeles waltl]|uniref:Secreted protein n=1 Tax=Pleurodeles waltl TaxID=8319 RepID=A0AAV7N6U4_PLEWA|nr:hypothetical protein NDU88_000037 [Pleurodeles waltl]
MKSTWLVSGACVVDAIGEISRHNCISRVRGLRKRCVLRDVSMRSIVAVSRVWNMRSSRPLLYAGGIMCGACAERPVCPSRTAALRVV